ncbi:uncharacterized protein LOC113321770 [Papaver somniferum]|nr:uncharacterized protein LOC113321770 [Papaver somniferum]
MQHDMLFEEDNLHESEAEQAASETVNNGIATTRTLNAEDVPFQSYVYAKTDTYMWKVVYKRDTPGQSLNLEAGYWSGASSSRQPLNIDHDYVKNWQLMQSFFHWDSPLPAPKKLKITEIDLNCTPEEPVPEAPRDIYVVGEQAQVNTHPHQWFKGEGSNSNPASNDPKAKGKEIAKLG